MSGNINKEITAKLNNAKALDEQVKRKTEEARKEREAKQWQEEADLEVITIGQTESSESGQVSKCSAGTRNEFIKVDVEEFDIVEESRSSLKSNSTKRPSRKRSSSVLLKH